MAEEVDWKGGVEGVGWRIREEGWRGGRAGEGWETEVERRDGGWRGARMAACSLALH